MTRLTSSPPELLLLLVVLAMGAQAATTIADHRGTRPFSEAEIFLELNDTDDDLGLHGSIDGGPWTSLAVEGPTGRTLLDVISRGRVRSQGMTQLFFESAEPNFEVLDPERFLQRFPEGRYLIEGVAQDGGELAGTARLSHVLAAPPDNVLVSGSPAAESCDADDLPVAGAPVLISWDPVTSSHPVSGRFRTPRSTAEAPDASGGSLGTGCDRATTDRTMWLSPTSCTRHGTDFNIGRRVVTVFNPVGGGPDRVVTIESSAEPDSDGLLVETPETMSMLPTG